MIAASTARSMASWSTGLAGWLLATWKPNRYAQVARIAALRISATVLRISFMCALICLTVNNNIASVLAVVNQKNAPAARAHCEGVVRVEREGFVYSSFSSRMRAVQLLTVGSSDEGGPRYHSTDQRSVMLDASQCSQRRLPNDPESLRLSLPPLVLFGAIALVVASY